jgi:serine acetyltransferase
VIWNNPPNPQGARAEISHEFRQEHVPLLVALCLACIPLGLFSALCAALWRIGIWSCRWGFGIGYLLLHGRPTDEAAWTWQAARSLLITEAESMPHWNVPLRKALLRLAGVRVGSGAFYGRGGVMDDYHPENIVIEDGATISYGVTFAGHGDRERIPLEAQRVIIRQDAYIGTGVVLTPGVEIGQGATIGAGAVVTRDIPAYGIAVGVPARVIAWHHPAQPVIPAAETRLDPATLDTWRSLQ